MWGGDKVKIKVLCNIVTEAGTRKITEVTSNGIWISATYKQTHMSKHFSDIVPIENDLN